MPPIDRADARGPLVPAAALTDYIARIFVGTGSPEDEARRIADHLVGANLRGHDSHGVIRTPAYVTLAAAGTLKPGAASSIVRESASTALLDGGWNYGQIAAYDATNLANSNDQARISYRGIVRLALEDR